MRRHPALAELSRDHHQALAVALTLRRATAETSADARAAFLVFWREGGAPHFAAEEEVLLPALGEHALCERICAEHDAIRADAAALAAADAPVTVLAQLGDALTAHVRLEERELFPLLERTFGDEELWRLGAAVEASEARHRRSAEHAAPAPGAARPGQLRALALATLAFTACFYAWSLLGPLSPDLQKAIGLSDLQSAVMVAVPVLLGSLMRVPLGVLTDHFGARRTMTALIAASLPPVVGLALWHGSLGVVLALGLWLGLAGSSFAAGVPFVNRWYEPDRRGFALGLYGMGMGGTVLGALTAPRIADAWGLSAAFWVAAGVLTVAGVTFVLLAREAEPVRAEGRVRLLAPLAVMRGDGRAWALTLFYFLSFGGFVALFLYLPKLLVGVHDLTKADAGARAAGFALFAVLARPAGGWLSDRLGAERVLRLAFAATALLALGLAAGYPSMVPLTMLCLSIAVAFGIGTGAVFKLVPSWFPDSVGAVTGVVGAAGGLGGFFPPLVMAAVKALTGGYAIGFVLLAVVAGVALAVLTSVGRRSARRDAAAPALPAAWH